MTDEEIKKIAREYAENVKSEYVSAKLIETLVMGFYHSRLKTDYCIVPKSKIKEWSEKSEFAAFDTIDLIEIFDDLFGKELFTGKEDDNGM